MIKRLLFVWTSKGEDKNTEPTMVVMPGLICRSGIGLGQSRGSTSVPRVT